MQALADQLDSKEESLAKAEDRLRQMAEERTVLLSKQKELHWEKD